MANNGQQVQRNKPWKTQIWVCNWKTIGKERPNKRTLPNAN